MKWSDIDCTVHIEMDAGIDADAVVTFKQYVECIKLECIFIFLFLIYAFSPELTHARTGGMPDIMYYTGRRYYSGIIGCISEIVLGGELKLSLDPETLGLAHNVEPGYF